MAQQKLYLQENATIAGTLLAQAAYDGLEVYNHNPYSQCRRCADCMLNATQGVHAMISTG